MTTQVCEFVAYGETEGAPLCVCSLASAQAWQGAEHDQTRYWDVVEGMGQTLLFAFDAYHHFFNTETGNFALFRSADGIELVVAEVLTAEESPALPWRGLRFSGNPNTRAPLALRGWTCFFDAALTLPASLLPPSCAIRRGQKRALECRRAGLPLRCDLRGHVQVRYPALGRYLLSPGGPIGQVPAKASLFSQTVPR